VCVCVLQSSATHSNAKLEEALGDTRKFAHTVTTCEHTPAAQGDSGGRVRGDASCVRREGCEAREASVCVARSGDGRGVEGGCASSLLPHPLERDPTPTHRNAHRTS